MAKNPHEHDMTVAPAGDSHHDYYEVREGSDTDDLRLELLKLAMRVGKLERLMLGPDD